ncbi:unnamed protein product [Callosobruchus maculatus]|uniref:C2H2-type domain-containing protein n=1 Tax=Callosobruchus maculatus TaxID=64391 RepID=A0A653CYQ5_CALMS|nr:unnamed protein product [Callosobruchus maculatus]
MSMHSGAGSSGELMSCEHCTATFKVEKSLDEHVVKKHPDFISSPNTCQHCKATFKIKRSLDDHIIKKHPKFATTVTCKVHFCTKCTFKTTLKSSLDKHMFIKHSDAAFCSKNACQHCNATFTTILTVCHQLLEKYTNRTGIYRLIFIANNLILLHVLKKHLSWIPSVNK